MTNLYRLKPNDETRRQLSQVYESFQEGFETPDLVEARALVRG